ncbi:Glycosyltransferase involved in cell wall bisynthesis [Salegentibacter holothuriorum]|uniref:Glycosyltransferase involved in cell wall bisynthesis n=1 Tax=Salegentibacter holothuriorum TaxID=241145 RepID=A0A1T5CLT2_9FLAO|nr:glycosyltransferase family 4 protein [Salegentibacter holothuriorum]SKB60452.1 Glycosyltransferase involved in cell wall bisynthesis [Salegentibacter holothuriorum]
MRFTIFTHVIHREEEGEFYAYSPYVREMNLWLKNAEEVEVVAPAPQPPKKEFFFDESYKHSRISFIKIPSFHLLNFQAVLDSIIKIPFIFFRILGAMHRADHLHLRCPGNIGLLAAIAQIFFPKKSKSVKYAGNWDPKAKQPWTYRFQKWILSNRLLSRNIKVLVYGNWPNQSDNIVSFFTASFSEREREPVIKSFKQPYKFIFTGNLVEGKGVFDAVNLIDALRAVGEEAVLEIYGDGVLESSLVDYIKKKELQTFVKLMGRKSLEELRKAYKNAHFVVLLSKSEGWPKALAEGMWYGCVPVATRVSCVPWMLNYGERGIIVPDIEKREAIKEKRRENIEKREERRDDKENFLRNCQFEGSDGSGDISRTGFSERDLAGIISLIENPEKLNEMSLAAQEWSQQYTLEKFEKAIKEMI